MAAGDGRQRRNLSFGPLLRRVDQAAAAALLLASLLAIGGYWLIRGGHSGGMIEIDEAPPRTARFQLDINEADWPELALLPGVGETLAKRIVESREQDGPFLDHSDLMRVRGIGPKTLQEMRPYLRPVPDARNIAGEGDAEDAG